MIEYIPSKFENALHIHATLNNRHFYFFMHKLTGTPLGSSAKQLWEKFCQKSNPQLIPENLNDNAHNIALRIMKGEKNIWPTAEEKAQAKRRTEELDYFRKMAPKIKNLLKKAFKVEEEEAILYNNHRKAA